MGSSGCLGCTERYLGCQSVCNTYKKYRMEIEERKKAKAKARHDSDIFSAYLKEDKTRRIRKFGS